MLSTRINARISGPLAAFVEKMVGPDGLYETPSEYIRDLIRRDMAQR
jgi:antitoxin ParD1/3/4